MNAAVLAGLAVIAAVMVAGRHAAAQRLTRLAAPARSRLSGAVVPAARRRSPGRRRDELAAAAADVPSGLALELRSGHDLASALTAVADVGSIPEVSARLRRAGVAALRGGDVGAALTGGRSLAADPVSEALQVTAACCSAARSAGLPLADLLDAAASAARSRMSLAGMATAELAGARSTILLLAGLPLVGVAMGQLLGAHPLRVLLTTGWGGGCLAGAVTLTVLGFWWSRTLATGLLRSLP